MRINFYSNQSTLALAAQLKQQESSIKRLEELHQASQDAPSREDAEMALTREGARKLEKELTLRAWEVEHGLPHHLQSHKKKKEE